MTTALDAADALVILTRIKAYHSPQSDDDATCDAWADALNYAGVTNVRDAVSGVMRHYTTPGANPWITPGDVIGHYRTIRDVRLKNVEHADLTEDVDPNDGRAYLATLRHRLALVGDGLTVEQAKRSPLPPEAAHAAIDPTRRLAILSGRNSD